MSKKEKFISILEDLFSSVDMVTFCGEDYEEFKEYFVAFKGQKDKQKSEMTDSGMLILNYMKENDRILKAKDIADGILKSSRSVAPSLKKLANDGYVEVIGDNPKSYCLTDKGKNYTKGEND